VRKPITQELQQPPARRELQRVGGVGQASGQVLMTPRERMWSAMLKLSNKAGGFTPSEIEDLASPITIYSVLDYLEALAKAQLAEKLSDQVIKPGRAGVTSTRWRVLVKWPTAPRLNKSGHVVTQGLGVLAMWRAARIRKTFTPNELCMDANATTQLVSLATARQYCIALERSGHFAYVTKGKGGKPSTFRIVRDTGPHAPAITRAKVVFDRNAATLHPIQTAEELINEQG
jgi:hypothetical protein